MAIVYNARLYSSLTKFASLARLRRNNKCPNATSAQIYKKRHHNMATLFDVFWVDTGALQDTVGPLQPRQPALQGWLPPILWG